MHATVMDLMKLCYGHGDNAAMMGYFVSVSLLVIQFGAHASHVDGDLTQRPGHLKRFGEGRPSVAVDALEGYPDTRTFTERYVRASRPVLMRGAARSSPAFTRWSDAYFLSLAVPADNTINVETRKKENRKQPTVDMHFKDFVKVYNKTDQYMVDPVPAFLKKDIVIPGPLQCEEYYKDKIVQAMMWFSSGGTKSVVHTDSVDNINCLYRGQKTLVMVNPHLYRDKVDMDHPEGAYSGVDVDRVDYTKYPGLAEVEFVHVNMSAGDCLFIPYKWIHQVRSYGSNIAVNVWWDFHRNKDVDLEKCTQSFDMSLTLEHAGFTGFDSITDDIGSIKDQLLDTVRHHNINYEKFEKIFLSDNEIEPEKDGNVYRIPVQEIFRLLDQDKNGEITRKEVETTLEEDWEKIKLNLKNLEVLLEALEKDLESQSADANLTPDERSDGNVSPAQGQDPLLSAEQPNMHSDEL